jgi:hypothetical protein
MGTQHRNLLTDRSTLSDFSGILGVMSDMPSSRLSETIARYERLQEWIQGLEKRISVERRFKVLTALRRELEKCQNSAASLQEAITQLQAHESKSQAS